jgi:hypothetical protein
MQTFLPYPDFNKSLECLDYRRLCKQRLEAKQILNALNGKSTGWVNHPATKMWKGYKDALSLYYDLSIDEWVRRGYRNTMQKTNITTNKFPQWFGMEVFHAAHRSNLLRKDAAYYGQFGWTEPHDLPYIWPS